LGRLRKTVPYIGEALKALPSARPGKVVAMHEIAFSS
jgi:hypothetical protein